MKSVFQVARRYLSDAVTDVTPVREYVRLVTITRPPEYNTSQPEMAVYTPGIVRIFVKNDIGLRRHARADGHDIHFADIYGNELPFELVCYSNGTGDWWVSWSGYSFSMYYGDHSRSADQSSSIWGSGIFHSQVMHTSYSGNIQAITDNLETRNPNSVLFNSYAYPESHTVISDSSITYLGCPYTNAVLIPVATPPSYEETISFGFFRNSMASSPVILIQYRGLSVLEYGGMLHFYYQMADTIQSDDGHIYQTAIAHEGSPPNGAAVIAISYDKVERIYDEIKQKWYLHQKIRWATADPQNGKRLSSLYDLVFDDNSDHYPQSSGRYSGIDYSNGNITIPRLHTVVEVRRSIGATISLDDDPQERQRVDEATDYYQQFMGIYEMLYDNDRWITIAPEKHIELLYTRPQIHQGLSGGGN